MKMAKYPNHPEFPRECRVAKDLNFQKGELSKMFIIESQTQKDFPNFNGPWLFAVKKVEKKKTYSSVGDKCMCLVDTFTLRDTSLSFLFDSRLDCARALLKGGVVLCRKSKPQM